MCFIWPMACFNDNTLFLPYDFLCSLFLIECQTLLNKNIITKVTPLTLLINFLPFNLWSCFVMFFICDHELCFFWASDLFHSHHMVFTLHTNNIIQKSFLTSMWKKTCNFPNAKNKPLSFTISFLPSGKWIRV